MKHWFIAIKNIPYILLFIFMIPLISQTQTKNTLFQLCILSNSTISIKGSSNINTFNCTACSPFKHNSIQGTLEKGKTVSLKGDIIVPIENFDCKHKVLTKDLRHTLSAKEHPYMTIRFIDIERMPNMNIAQDKLNGIVEIELAGKKRQFSIQYTISKKDNIIRVDGQRSFTFSDFELKPPKKLGGIIKVKDDFDVKFSLYLTKK